MWYYCNSVSYKAQRPLSPGVLCSISVLCLFVLCTVDGVWHGDFAQHQAPVVPDSPNRGSGSDSSSNVAGQGPLPALGLLPAVQRALFVRLTQKYQEDEEPSSTQPQRTPSKEEGVSGVMIASYLFGSTYSISSYLTATIFLGLIVISSAIDALVINCSGFDLKQ